LTAWFPGAVGTVIAEVLRVVPRVSLGRTVGGVLPGFSVLVEGGFLRLLFLVSAGALPPLVGV